MREVKISKEASDGLAARFARERAAAADRVSFLAGVCAAVGVSLSDVESLDDDRRVLVLKEDPAE